MHDPPLGRAIGHWRGKRDDAGYRIPAVVAAGGPPDGSASERKYPTVLSHQSVPVDLRCAAVVSLEVNQLKQYVCMARCTNFAVASKILAAERFARSPSVLPVLEQHLLILLNSFGRVSRERISPGAWPGYTNRVRRQIESFGPFPLNALRLHFTPRPRCPRARLV